MKEDYGVYALLARAKTAVESGTAIAEKIPAARKPIEKFCPEPYLLFDTEACQQSVALMIYLEATAPHNPHIVRAIIAGLQGLNRPDLGPANNYDDELRNRLVRLMEVEGQSTELLLEYAAVLEGKKQIEVLESIIATDHSAPAQAHASLGRSLINAGRHQRGIDELRIAFENASGRGKQNVGAALVQALRFYGSPQDRLEADRIEQGLQEM